MERIPMTPLGFDKINQELKRLKSVDRPQNIRDIETAREHGDLRENAEYHAAKEKQSLIEGRVRELEARLAAAEVIDPATVNVGDKIVFGAVVDLIDIDTEEKVTYGIVGDDESDIKERKIGISSPLAKGLIGRSKGDEVAIRTPKGQRTFEVIDVKYG